MCACIRSNAISLRAGRLGVILMILVLLAGACGSSEEPATLEADAAAGESAETPEPVEAGTPEPELDPTVPPGETEDEGTGPEDVLLTLFAAIEDANLATQLELSSGGVRTLLRIRDIIRQENERRGGTTSNEISFDEPAELVNHDGEVATIDLRARWRSVVSGDEGVVPSETEISGPVTLRRQGGGWVVSDLVYGERALAPEHTPVGERRARDGIALELYAVQGYGGVYGVVLELAHERDERLSVNITGLELTLDDGTRLDPVQVALTDADPAELFAAFDRTGERPVRLEVTLREHGGTDLRYGFSF